MDKDSRPSLEPTPPERKVDLSRFSQYLQMSTIITHLYLPDDLIIDKPSKYLPHIARGYLPDNTIKHLIWHMACSLYNRALTDKTFFLAGHKHLDICMDRKKVIELMHSVEHLDLTYFACENIDCKEGRRYRSVAYRTNFGYIELELPSFIAKGSIAITSFYCRFSLPKTIAGVLDIDHSKDSMAFKEYFKLYRLFRPHPAERNFSPFTIAGSFECNPITFALAATTGIGEDELEKDLLHKFSSYENLTFPLMINEIELPTSEDFFSDIRQAKASIIKSLQRRKKAETTLESILGEFTLYCGKARDFLNSPSVTAVALLLSVSGISLLTLVTLAKRILSKIEKRNPQEIIKVKIISDDKIILISGKEVIIELDGVDRQEEAKCIRIIAFMLKGLSEFTGTVGQTNMNIDDQTNTDVKDFPT